MEDGGKAMQGRLVVSSPNRERWRRARADVSSSWRHPTVDGDHDPPLALYDRQIRDKVVNIVQVQSSEDLEGRRNGDARPT
jgi:hypothetical protein